MKFSFVRSTRGRVALAATVAVMIAGGLVMPRGADAAGTVTVDPATPQEGNAGTPPFDVTFRLSQPAAASVTVTFSTVDGTGPNGATSTGANPDYVAKTNATIVFAPGESTKQVTLQTRGDTIFEQDEQFLVKIDKVEGDGFTGAGNTGTVTIQDDDIAPTVSVDNPNDTNESDGNMVFEIKLSKPSGSPTTVYVFTADPRDPNEVPPVPNAPRPATESPATDFDYTTKDGTAVTFPAGDTSETVSVPITSDLRDEFDEFIELQVRQGPAANSPELDFATGKLVDDDALARLDVGDPVAVNEPDTPCGQGVQAECTTTITFTITKNGATDKRVVVDYRTEDRSATSNQNDPNADYVRESGSGDPNGTPPGGGLSFAPNETQKQVAVQIRGDMTAEPDEIFAFIIENPVNATLGDAQGIGLISNDDGGSFPTVTVGNADAEAESSGGTPGTSSFTITVNRPLGNTASVNVCYATADGPETGSGAAAVAGSDYTAVNDCESIDFPQTSTTVDVPLINNAQNEPDEFFQLQILSAGNAAITDGAGEARITDDDPAPTLSIADKTNAEGTGVNNTTASLTVTMSGSSGQTVTVQCSTPQPNSGTATANNDYTVVTGQTLTFAPGDTSETCDVPVAADAVDEDNETVNVALSNPTGGATVNDGSGVLTITDDDNAPTVSIANTTVDEGSSTNPEATFQVTLSGPSSRTITVDAATANGTAAAPGDYTSKTQTLTFAPGDVTEDFKVTVIADTLDEADETFTAELTSPQHATLGTPSTATATIQDDDASPTLAINNATVAEGNSGTANATFTVTLSAASAQTVTVHFATADGTATQPGDYTATSGDLSFAPGDTSETIDVPVKGDSAVEPDETFSVNLTAPTNATLSDASGTGTIANDDSAGGTTTTTSTTTTSTTSTSTTTSTTTTTIPPNAAANLTTGPGPSGGPHIRVFQPNGNPTAVSFFDGTDSNGKRVARGDLNGDGIDEIITGAGVNSPSVMSVYSSTGQLISSRFTYGNNGDWFGGVFVGAGDVTGDAKEEIITGVGPGGGPHVRIWRLDGANLVEVGGGFMAYTNAQGQPNWNGGVTVAAGDLAGDGKAEIVTGVGAGGGPHVKAFSYNGTTASELFGFMAYTTSTGQPNWNGGVNVAVGNLDGTGKSEIATTPWAGGGAHLKLFNSDGSVRHHGIIASTNPNFSGGLTVAIGNLDGVAGDEIAVATMTQLAAVRTFKGDLSAIGTTFNAYNNFGGGVWVAIGLA